MNMSLGTPVADSPPPVDAPPPIEADMAGRPQTRFHLLGLPFPNRGLGFAGKTTGKSRSRRPQDSGLVPRSPAGAPVSQGLASRATTYDTVLAGRRTARPGPWPMPHAVHRDVRTAAATLD